MANRMKILVAYDGSECADAALDDLRRAGLSSDAQIKVLMEVRGAVSSADCGAALALERKTERSGAGVGA
jgi:nucleotide-binding universal stress UspA family protein